MVPFPLDLVFIYAIYYDSGFMSFFVISATYCLFFVLEISLMQSNSVVISFDCMRFFLFIFCEMWLWKSAYMRIVLIYPLREWESTERKKTDRTSPYGIRSFSIWSTLCGSPVLCRVVCALWKIIIIRNKFFECVFVRTIERMVGCFGCLSMCRLSLKDGIGIIEQR